MSLSLPARRLGLVYGRSGSGKSTLLQLLAGLVAPTGGSIALVEGPGPGLCIFGLIPQESVMHERELLSKLRLG